MITFIKGSRVRSLITAFTFLVMTFMAAPSAIAASQPSGPTPIGMWRTYDLDGIARSIVRFYQVGGKLQGQIVKNLNPASGQAMEETCTHCKGANANRKKVGMVVVWGLTPAGDKWENGSVLDTDSGSVYRCNVSVSPNGQTLHLHAYVAIPILGKTVDWTRVK